MYVCGKRLQKGSMYVCGIAVCTYAERDCRKEVHTESVVALSNSEGQTAGGTRERAGRVGVTKKAKICSAYFFYERNNLSILLPVCRAYIYVHLDMPSYVFFRIYFNAWYITCCPKREAPEIYIRVIGEVLVLGLLVVVYKIPYRICM